MSEEKSGDMPVINELLPECSEANADGVKCLEYDGHEADGVEHCFTMTPAMEEAAKLRSELAAGTAPATDADEAAASASDAGEAAPAEAGKAPPPEPKEDPRKPIEFWCEQLGTPKWLFAGAKLGKNWAIGQEVTREDYEAAVEWAANIPCQ